MADAITTATRTVLLPELRPLEFQPRTDRVVGRIVDGILQFLSVHVSSRGSRQFCVNYASLCLCRPRDFLSLSPGGILGPSGKPRPRFQPFRRQPQQSWFPGATDTEAADSMRQILVLVRREAVPFFEQTRTVSGLLEYLEHQDWASRHHLEFELGCCLARMGQHAEAQAHLEQALREYEADGRDWCVPEADRVRRLLAALDQNQAFRQLSEWEAESVRSLDVSQLLDPAA